MVPARSTGRASARLDSCSIKPLCSERKSVTLSLFLHLLSVVVWVGGMFFAYMALRPVAASVLEPPQRLALWAGVFGKFFPWVWASVVLILLSGLYMLMLRGGGSAPHYAMTMLALGLVM